MEGCIRKHLIVTDLFGLNSVAQGRLTASLVLKSSIDLFIGSCLFHCWVPGSVLVSGKTRQTPVFVDLHSREDHRQAV